MFIWANNENIELSHAFNLSEFSRRTITDQVAYKDEFVGIAAKRHAKKSSLSSDQTIALQMIKAS